MPRLTLFFKGQLMHSLDLQQSLLLGSGEHCDVRLEGIAVANRHARISLLNEQWVIQTVDAKSTLVNHAEVSKHILCHGDHIQIGRYCLSYSDPQAQQLDSVDAETERFMDGDTEFHLERLVGNISALPRGGIQLLNGEHIGKIIPLSKALTRLGMSGSQCAMIAHRSDGYYLSHLEGKVQPKVDHRLIGDHTVPLRNGQVIELGKTRMRFFEEIAQPAAS